MLKSLFYFAASLCLLDFIFGTYCMFARYDHSALLAHASYLVSATAMILIYRIYSAEHNARY